MAAITPSQLKKIHVLSHERGLDNDLLHAYVFEITKKDSLKKLTVSEAIRIIDDLSGEKKTTIGQMSEAQFKYIKGLAKDLGWVNEHGKLDEHRLLSFILERFQVERFEWLTVLKASQVIEALKAMNKRVKEEKAI